MKNKQPRLDPQTVKPHAVAESRSFKLPKCGSFHLARDVQVMVSREYGNEVT